MILVDYGVGNLHSVRNALVSVGAKVQVSSQPEAIAQADRLVVPGVGAFGDGMQALQQRGLVNVIKDYLNSGRPFLGICLGMQILFEKSDELGQHQGLGHLKGCVRHFPEVRGKIPHTGWNRLSIQKKHPLLRNISDGAYAYFNHSYICEAQPAVTIASSDHDITFTAAVASGAVMGVQFHPEKSQAVGLQILKNFVEFKS